MDDFIGSGTASAPFVLQPYDSSMFRPIEPCPDSDCDVNYNEDTLAAISHMREVSSSLDLLYASLNDQLGLGSLRVKEDIIYMTNSLVLARHTLDNLVNPMGFPHIMSLPHPDNLRRWYRREVDYVAHWACVDCKKLHPQLNQVVFDATPAVIVCPNRKCLNHWFKSNH